VGFAILMSAVSGTGGTVVGAVVGLLLGGINKMVSAV
jgi:hypothetical protein